MLGATLHGGEVCRRIHAACPSAKSIIMTGYRDVASSAKSVWSELAETVLEKPFHREEMLWAVRKALGSDVAIPLIHTLAADLPNAAS